jgi:nucleoside phosphorylase
MLQNLRMQGSARPSNIATEVAAVVEAISQILTDNYQVDQESKMPTYSGCHAREDYTVGWICALSQERDAAIAMLDEIHGNFLQIENDDNVYSTGRIGTHNVVIVCPPISPKNNILATKVVTSMVSTFPHIQIGLLVGICGSIPSSNADVRLGDVVISHPDWGHSDFRQYAYGKSLPKDSKQTSSLTGPSWAAFKDFATLQAKEEQCQTSVLTNESRTAVSGDYFDNRMCNERGPEKFYFYIRDIYGPKCNEERETEERRRLGRPLVHYSTITSGFGAMKEAATRNQFNSTSDTMLCPDIEAAESMDLLWLVIRGVCHYGDSHKSQGWRLYAAATAAAYTKTLLSMTTKDDIAKTSMVRKTISTVLKAERHCQGQKEGK